MPRPVIDLKEDSSLFAEIVKRKIKFMHQESDLYIRQTKECADLVKEFYSPLDKMPVQSFEHLDDKKRWLDVPFAYDPFWEGR